MSLYNLPKDILVKLIAKIQQETHREIQERYQRKIDNLEFLLGYHIPNYFDKEGSDVYFGKYYCSEKNCEFYCYGQSIDLLMDVLYDGDDLFRFSVDMQKKENIREHQVWLFDVSCLNVHNEYVDDKLFSQTGVICTCCRTWHCHMHFKKNIEKHEKYAFVCKTCCEKGCKF